MISQYMTGNNLGIDQFFINAYLTTNTTFPGRPAPNTSICFILISGIILLYQLTANKIIYNFLFGFTFLIMIFSTISFIGYILGISTTISFGRWTGMALHTSIGMFISSVGILSVINNGERKFALEKISIFSFLIMSVFVLLVWQHISNKDNIKVISLIDKTFDHNVRQLIARIDQDNLAISRMRDRINKLNDVPLEFWKMDSRNFLNDIYSIYSQGIVYPDNRIEYVSKDSSQSIIAKNEIKDCYNNFKKSSKMNSIIHNNNLCRIDSIRLKNKEAFLVTVFDLPDFMKAYESNIINEGYGLELTHNKKIIFTISNNHPELKTIWGINTNFIINGIEFTLLSWPDTKTINKLASNLPLYFLFAGLAFTLILSITIWGVINALMKSNEAKISEEKLKSLINSVKEYSVIMLDKAGKISVWNKSAKRMHQYNEAEALGMDVSLLYKNDITARHIRERFDESIVKGEYEEEVINLRKDGSEFIAKVIIRPIYDEKHLLGFSKVTKDLTEQKEVESKFAKLYKQLESIMDSSHLPIIATDLNGIITNFNQAAESILGYSDVEIIGKMTPEIFHDKDEIITYAKELSSEYGYKIEPGFNVFIKKLDNEDAVEKEWTYISKSGKRTPVLLSVTSLKDKDNKVYGYLGIAIDISERKEVEKVKNEFISIVSHELRTPLTSIHGSICLLAEGVAGKQSSKALDLLNIALKNTERLIRLINDILDIDKIESGKMRFNFHSYSAISLLKEAVLCNKSFAERFNIQLIINHTIDSKTTISVDHDKFIQIITNLIANAIKFSPENSDIIIDSYSNEKAVTICITDHGPGIPDNFIKHIFNRFTQADTSSSRKQQGSGLGLNISKRLVDQMGGHISFKTEKNKGTTFIIEFPILSDAPNQSNENNNGD